MTPLAEVQRSAAAQQQQQQQQPAAAPGRFEPAARVTLRDILTPAARDWRRIAAALLTGLLLTAVAALIAPKRYTSEAALLLRIGREYVYTPELGEPGAGQAVTYDHEQTLQAEARIALSHDVVATVVDRVGPARIFPWLDKRGADPAWQRARAELALEKALDAELAKSSNLLQLSLRLDDAATAQRVLEQVIEAYREKRQRVFASASYATAQANLAARSAQLDAAEAALAAYKRARNIRSFTEEQTLLLAQRNAVEQKQSDVALSLSQADGRSSALNARIANLPGEVVVSSETQRGEAAESARKLLLDLKLKERDASARYFDGEPVVQDLRADVQKTADYLRELDAQPPRSVRTGRSPLRDLAESDLLRSGADLGQARAGRSALTGQRAAIEGRLALLADSEAPLRRLERERRLGEANYETAARHLRDEVALADMDRRRQSNISVVQQPTLPLEAKSARTIVLLVGLLLSVGAALLAAFLSALWRDTFLTPGDAQRTLGVPMLAAIPRARS